MTPFKSLCKLLLDEGHHFGFLLLSTLEQSELVARTHEVVLGILDFVVSVAVEVVGKETHQLHVGEELGSVGQVLDFDGGEEGTRRLQITFGERLEDVHAEFDFVIFRTVLGLGVGS